MKEETVLKVTPEPIRTFRSRELAQALNKSSKTEFINDLK